MTTGYPGRTGEHDLGGGHSFTWTEYGITESHNYGPSGGWHGWDIILAGTGWQVAGSPGNEGHLTIAVPLTCPLCGITFRIERGRAVPA